MKPTTVHRPQSLTDALTLAAAPGAVALAGGCLLFAGDTTRYDSVVDLQDVEELCRIERREDGLSIGGAVLLQDIVESHLVPAALKRSLTRALSNDTRCGASVAESLLVDQPPAEWLAALVAMDARIRQVGPDPEDLRMRPLDNFIHYGHGQAAFSILTHLLVPILPKRTVLGSAFVADASEAPIVAASACVSLNDAGRVERACAAISGASSAPIVKIDLLTLAGNPLDEANIASAAKFIAPNVAPVSDSRASADNRREMARTIVHYALQDCLAQLRS